MRGLFPEAVVYDKYLPEFAATKAAVSRTSICFVCVPTPAGPRGHADLSMVEEVLEWLAADIIVLKSTVPPGATTRLRATYRKRVVCAPEYQGESRYRYRPTDDPRSWPFVVVGGPLVDTRPVVELFARVLGPDVTYRQVPAEVAELAKYMENAWLATQVAFAWQFGMLADAVGADYWEVREIWALDPRVSRWHTALFRDAPGFDGKCLPKDLAAIIGRGRELGCHLSLLEAIQEFNQSLRARSPHPDGE